MNITKISTLALLTSLALPAAASSILETELDGMMTNNNLASAQSVGYASFTSNADVNVFGALPTATVQGRGAGGDVDFFRFRANPGTAYFDIDNQAFSFDTALSLFDAAGTLLGYADDSAPADPGSADGRDAFLGSFNLAYSGDYYLAVSEALNLPSGLFSATSFSDLLRPDGGFGGNAVLGATTDASFAFNDVQAGSPYTLNISLQNPVPEPGSLALLGLGRLMMIATLMRRRVVPCSSR